MSKGRYSADFAEMTRWRFQRFSVWLWTTRRGQITLSIWLALLVALLIFDYTLLR